MKRLRWALLVLLVAFPTVGCSSGGECDTCSVDADCSGGLVCVNFSDGSRRCGSGTGTTQCRVF
jgi:hypothetical protein